METTVLKYLGFVFPKCLRLRVKSWVLEVWHYLRV